LKTFTAASAKLLKGCVNTDMNKTLYTLLIGLIGFYALLFAVESLCRIPTGAAARADEAGESFRDCGDKDV
jgi:hypothetical protein